MGNGSNHIHSSTDCSLEVLNIFFKKSVFYLGSQYRTHLSLIYVCTELFCVLYWFTGYTCLLSYYICPQFNVWPRNKTILRFQEHYFLTPSNQYFHICTTLTFILYNRSEAYISICVHAADGVLCLIINKENIFIHTIFF